jgi:hypothetical protein
LSQRSNIAHPAHCQFPHGRIHPGFLNEEIDDESCQLATGRRLVSAKALQRMFVELRKDQELATNREKCGVAANDANLLTYATQKRA